MRKLLLYAILLVVVCYAAVTGYYLWPGTPLEAGVTADKVVVLKGPRKLLLMKGDEVLKAYRISMGAAPYGHKERQGDGRTPEGTFQIDRKNPRSQFHLSLGLNYPLAEDRARARAGGYDPGGDIFIHGQSKLLGTNGFVGRDWTLGCIAVSNAAMEELFAAISVGTTVEIRP